MSTGHPSRSGALPLRFMLSFTDPAVEKSFVKHYTEFYCRFAQASIGSGVALLAGDFLVDFLVNPNQSGNLLRLLVCIPFLGAVLAYSFTQHAKSHWQPVMAAAIVVFAFCLFWVLQVIEGQGGHGLKSWVGILNFTFLEFYCFVILGVQFRYALVSGGLILLAFEWALWLNYGMDIQAFAYWSYHVVTLFALPLGIGWWREFLLRTEFSVKTSLEESRQTAERLTNIKSNFLAAMSHEIRTPMNAIIGMSHLVLEMELQPRQRNYIEKVNRSAENLLGIINDILDFSKIEAGKSTLEMAGFRLEDVMDNLANLTSFKAEDKGLELLFSIDPATPTALVGDPLRLGQVLVNLANNAVKFTDRGEVIVGIESVAQTEQDVELHFWVKDSGIGISAEQQGQLFQSFSQADTSITRKYGGTGLGLFLSKQFVEMMGGKIWLESASGKGAVFHFQIRFGLQFQPVPPGADALAGLRALVADDNRAAREILAAMSESLGLAVDTAPDSRQAIELLESAEKNGAPYDLILLDWRMPGMEGAECIGKLRDARLRNIPAVVMLIPYGREAAFISDDGRGARLPVPLAKPATPSMLLDAIGEALGNGAGGIARAVEKAGWTSGARQQLQGARLLLVEDNALNRELAQELLSSAGIDIVLASHGREALDILALDARFDGVLMDCQMPVMDGYSAAREIRNNALFANLPIIAMTANAMSGDRDQALSAGMTDHIAKPLNVNAMFATLGKWIVPARAPGNAIGTVFLSAPPLQQMQDVPGIDTRDGLARALNNRVFYRKLLVTFHDSQSGFADIFRGARQDADPTAAARAAHTLGGAAANIGAKGIQDIAAALEGACSAGLPQREIDVLLVKTLDALRPVIGHLADLKSEMRGRQVSVRTSHPDVFDR